MNPRIPVSVLEAPCCVYIHHGRRGPLYVGIANDFAARLAQHRRDSSWWPSVVDVELIACPSRAEAAKLEMLLIGEIQPPHNIVGTPRDRVRRMGERNYQTKLSDDETRAVIRRVLSGEDVYEIAKEVGISASAASSLSMALTARHLWEEVTGAEWGSDEWYSLRDRLKSLQVQRKHKRAALRKAAKDARPAKPLRGRAAA